MKFSITGLNHKSAPVEVRERLAFDDHSLAAPACPARVRGIAKGQRRAAAHRDLPQLSAREKPYPLAVG